MSQNYGMDRRNPTRWRLADPQGAPRTFIRPKPHLSGAWSALAVCLLLSITDAARADWHEVSSDHFVILSDQKPETVRAFSEKLELFHAALAHVFKQPNVKPSPSNRVTIYVVASESLVRKFAKTDNRFLAGIYRPRAGAALAVVPKLEGGSDSLEMSPQTILFHEYAHHFMYGLTIRAYPRWFTEGFAEFFAGVRFEPDSIALGLPATHRALELTYSKSVPIRELLDFYGRDGKPQKQHDSFYGQSWALFHYLMFEPERSGQLTKYQTLLAAGNAPLEAAEGAFGDLDKLEREVTRYLDRKRMLHVKIQRTALAVGPIAVRKLPEGEAEMVPTRLRSRMGVSREEALALVPEARRIAAAYPGEPAVLAELAEAEFDSGHFDAAIAAADRAIALDPRQVDAYIQKGYALSSKIKDGTLSQDAWKDVRTQFVNANKVESDHPIPLINFYTAYLEQGQPPTKNSIDGLEWAMQLAPFDASLRWMVAQQMIRDERLAEAASTLAPLAYSPHPGDRTAAAQKLLREVEQRISDLAKTAAN